MRAGLFQGTQSTTAEPGRVSGRFLSDLFGSLERQLVPATQILGDLPIPIDETGRVTRSVEWADFAAFMKRLEHHLGGPEELERCGQRIGELKPAGALRSLAGFSASPYALYRAASHWALRRAIPGVEAELEEIAPNHIAIRARLQEGLRPCPQIFHLATGGARALPRILGMCDAVVSAEIGDCEARYEIIVPPSRTLWARVKRVGRTLFSASSVLQYLEAQQLELHEKHQALQRTHAALAESELRYRLITDTAVDVLCELNGEGQIEYVSASVEDLLGYTPEQVTGSHFSLWVATPFRDLAKQRLQRFVSQPIEEPIDRQRIRLHSDSGEPVVAELSMRSYRTPEGEVRMVGILRDQTDRHSRRAHRNTKERTGRRQAATTRMSEIVSDAMVQAPDDTTSFRWIETEKLVDMVEFEFHARSPVAATELQIDGSDAPPLIWGDETLLRNGLGSLLAWAIEGATKPPILLLRIESSEERAVVLGVSQKRDEGSSRNATREDRKADGSADHHLAAAEAAANALGGVLIRPKAAGDGVSRIQLPQPLRLA